MTYRPKNILVTGGMGFIGSHFIEYLSSIESVSKIVNIDKLTYAASKENIARLGALPKHEFIKEDICESTVVSAILEDYSIDTIVNFAAESHVDNSINSPNDFITTNIVGTFTLLEEAKKYWGQSKISEDKMRFHHVSTDEVYGSIGKDQESPMKARYMTQVLHILHQRPVLTIWYWHIIKLMGCRLL